MALAYKTATEKGCLFKLLNALFHMIDCLSFPEKARLPHLFLGDVGIWFLF
jgi:hypothetical protein